MRQTAVFNANMGTAVIDRLSRQKTLENLMNSAATS